MKYALLFLMAVTYASIILGLQGCLGPKGDTGNTGAQGIQGVPGVSVQAQPFCPNINGGIGFQEQYIIIDGKAYAVYYDGTHTFLALLKPGNYVTTDGRSCHFIVNADGSIQ